jgi:hypothetical protein
MKTQQREPAGITFSFSWEDYLQYQRYEHFGIFEQ